MIPFAFRPEAQQPVTGSLIAMYKDVSIEPLRGNLEELFLFRGQVLTKTKVPAPNSRQRTSDLCSINTLF